MKKQSSMYWYTFPAQGEPEYHEEIDHRATLLVCVMFINLLHWNMQKLIKDCKRCEYVAISAAGEVTSCY